MHFVFLCILILLPFSSSALPKDARNRRYPKQAMMISGYYGLPFEMNPDFSPSGLMSTFASGDTVSTNSYGDRKEPPPVEEPSAETPYEPNETLNPKEQDDSEQEQWPFQLGNRKLPTINTFFPISFGGSLSRNGKSHENENEGYSGSATAIANSFSTGRGGVANSHATAFGDPYSATLFRKNLSKKNLAKDE